jgi:2,4-dienoyl-CoA reductase (NADPH2)
VLGYLEVLRDKKPVGKNGGASSGPGASASTWPSSCWHEGDQPERWTRPSSLPSGAWTPPVPPADRAGIEAAHLDTVPRKVYLLQRKVSKVGDGLGKTTGWIHRTALKNRGVEMIAGVTYRQGGRCGFAHHRGR